MQHDARWGVRAFPARPCLPRWAAEGSTVRPWAGRDHPRLDLKGQHSNTNIALQTSLPLCSKHGRPRLGRADVSRSGHSPRLRLPDGFYEAPQVLGTACGKSPSAELPTSTHVQRLSPVKYIKYTLNAPPHKFKPTQLPQERWKTVRGLSGRLPVKMLQNCECCEQLSRPPCIMQLH